MSLSNSSYHEEMAHGDQGLHTYETLREQFVRPQEQTSIFDDNVEDILEMNAAIAMLTKNHVNDPLEADNESFPEPKQKKALNDEDLEQTTTAVLAKLNEQENDNLLYDSDGNPIEMYEYDDEISEEECQKPPVGNDTELPIRMGYLNMNRYLFENGLTTNIIVEQKQEEISKSKVPSFKIDRIVDSATHGISQGISFSELEQVDSDEDILEVFEIKDVKKQAMPVRAAKHKELLRLAQEQAKKRRIEDQDYIAYRIAEHKRKKQLKRDAKLAKEAEGKPPAETETTEILSFQKSKKLLKKSEDSQRDCSNDAQNQPMSEADLNNILVDEEVDSNRKETELISDTQYSEEDISTRELPSSQGAFRKCTPEEDNLEGIIDELNSLSDDSSSESENSDVIESMEHQLEDDTCNSDSEKDINSENQINQSEMLLGNAFKADDKESNEDMLNLLSGQFTFPVESQPQQVSGSEILGLLSGEFLQPQAEDDMDSKNETVNENVERLSSSLAENDSEIEDSNTVISSDDEASCTPQAAQTIRNLNEVLMEKKSVKVVTDSKKSSVPLFKTAFVEEEADVEEDEFMNFGGADGEIDARLDRYEPEFVEEADKEVVEDYDDVIELHRKQMLNKHEADVSKLLHDVTTGNLRKRSQRGDGNGKGLDTDSDEENDILLRKIRKKSAPAFMLDDIDDSDMTHLQKLAADPRSLAFAKCFVRDENDYDGCISSDDESGEKNQEKILSKTGASESADSENSDSEDEESFSPIKSRTARLKFKAVLSDEEEESVQSIQENIPKSFNKEEDLQDPNFYHTTLSSELLGLDIFGIVKERRLRVQNSKRNKVQESELYKYAYKRTIESTRISQKQSFAVFAKATEGNRSLSNKQGDLKGQKKSFSAFQLSSSSNLDVRTQEHKPKRQEKKKNMIEPDQPNLNIVSLLTRKF